MQKVCVLTSVHPRNDTRIFLKEIPALLKSGFETCVIVADGQGNTNSNGYNILDVGMEKSHLKRIINTSRKIYKEALGSDADIYHFHDPELILVGLKLSKRGKKVIYDVHEDVPRDILSKEWIGRPFRKLISFFFELLENYASKHFSLILTSTPFIKERFLKICERVENINNYPLLNEFNPDCNWEQKENAACYIGNINKARGISSIVDAMQNIAGTLYLAGSFDYESYRAELMKSPGWTKVNEVGYANRDRVNKIFSKSVCGMVLFLPEPNHIDSQPNKMFEYMAAGIPVVCSDFRLWKNIIEQNQCGICVNPNDTEEIAGTVNYLISNPDIAKQMGENGKKAVAALYNWAVEEEKLIQVYQKLI